MNGAIAAVATGVLCHLREHPKAKNYAATAATTAMTTASGWRERLMEDFEKVAISLSCPSPLGLGAAIVRQRSLAVSSSSDTVTTAV